MNHVIVPQSSVALLYIDGVFQEVLQPGRHDFHVGWFDRKERCVKMIDVREQSLTLKGQEILTADKVAIRVSLLIYFKVVDPVAALHNVTAYAERIYEDVQLAARRFLATRKLDAILSDRNEVSDAVRTDVRASAQGYGVEILRADVKDLVFPGNLRQIMNQVLETERRAEASLLQARKNAEAAKIQAASQAETAQLQAQAEVTREQLKSAAELGRIKQRLTLSREEAEAVRRQPELLKLAELRALTEMAQAGGKFVVKLGSDLSTTPEPHAAE